MIIITGAAGFIGSVLVASLNALGRSDLILSDRLSASDKWKNLPGKSFIEYIDHEELLLRLESGDLGREKIEAVVHIGARTDTTETDSALLMKLNYEYSRRICGWAHHRGVRFIYASSAAVYGDGELGFSDADDLTPRLRPLNGYAFTKWLFDQWAIRSGLVKHIAGLRFFNVYGPNEYHKKRMASVVYHAFPKAINEGVVQLFESDRSGIANGEQKRDFVYVKDIARVVNFFLKNHQANGIFNLGSGRARAFNDLAASLLKACDKPASGIKYFPMPADLKGKYQYFTEADLSRLRAAGFAEPMTTLESGVDDYVRNYLRKPEPRM
ncbi:MAG: ADP-glyceromanno-heptose 6-epimerase [Planctomycetes bacterium]|nr:ADP-glyceromanno-heptose 6-epimerase [Planctomycetota bacterium]